MEAHPTSAFNILKETTCIMVLTDDEAIQLSDSTYTCVTNIVYDTVRNDFDIDDV